MTIFVPSLTLRIPGTIPKEFFLPGPRRTIVLFSSDSVTTTNSVPLAPTDPVGTFTFKFSGFWLLISPVTILTVPTLIFDTIFPTFDWGS